MGKGTRKRVGEYTGDQCCPERDAPSQDRERRVNWLAVFFLILVVLPGVLGAMVEGWRFFTETKAGKQIAASFGLHTPTFRERVEEFYRQHNPTKLSEVPKLVKKFRGKEEDLFRMLEKKYADA